MENIHEDTLNPEEIKAEEEALLETQEEEIKKVVIEKFGLDEEANPELIAQIVADKLEERKKLSTAIKQKRSWRDKFNTIPKEKSKEDVKTQPDIDALVDKKLNEKLETKELESVELSDDLKAQIKSYAALNKVSIKQAIKSEYIQFQIGKEKEKAEIDDASISGKHDRVKSNRNFKDMAPEDFDVSTEQGLKDWEEYKKYLKSLQ